MVKCLECTNRRGWYKEGGKSVPRYCACYIQILNAQNQDEAYKLYLKKKNRKCDGYIAAN
jgi:hypothetical protein